MSRLIDIYQGNKVHRLDETDMPLTIGSGHTAHIRLSAGHERVAYVGESRNHLFLQPVGEGQSLYHNDEHVTRSVWLKSGDRTRIGDTLLQWTLSGHRLEVHISSVSGVALQPPAEAPDENARDVDNPDPGGEIPLVSPPTKQTGRKLRATIISLFLLLLTAAAFVLLAKPLVITVTPAPDNIEISGFPPVIQLGDHYLGIVGKYLLRAEKTGYRPLEEQIEITSQGGKYVFSMEEMPGLIDIQSKPPGATLLIDGTAIGTTPLQDAEITAGSHTLRFEHARYRPVEKAIDVTGHGEKLTVQVKLEPAWAMYTLNTDPEGASVAVDGIEQGVTPMTLELIAGQRELLFSREKFSPLTISLTVEAGQDTIPPTFELESAPATATITSHPAGATVTANGTFLGRTPVTITLKAMVAHQLQITNAGYLPASRTLILTPDAEQQLDFKLEPQYGTVFIAATPPAATLTIDGKVQQQAVGRFRLTTRSHTVELKADGYETLSRRITPQVGYSQRLELELSRIKTPISKTGNKGQESAVTSGLGQSLVLVEPQPFLMGASRNEAGRRANESERRVLLQRSFYLSRHEVSNAEYRQYNAQHSSGLSGNRSLDIDSHPVANVTWDDAARFLNWLSKRDGLPPFYNEVNGAMVAANNQGVGYRLPTEAEWAYTARMAKRKARARYPWQGKYPPQAKVGNFADESARHLLPVVIANYHDGFAASAPTGSFAANPADIYDLGGNLAEWCHDYYAANPGQGLTDPMGPATGNHHVIRGSSWRDASITELRFSYRRYSKEAANDVGFRIARYAR